MIKKKIPDYYKIIPEKLHKDADALVDYVRYFPYQTPTQCPYCGYHSFRQATDINAAGQPRFNCNSCERNFSQLTGSYFAHMSHMDLWPDFVIYRLSGLSFQKISRLLAISENACQIRERKLYQMMEDLFPALYQWWKPHHEFTDRKVTDRSICNTRLPKIPTAFFCKSSSAYCCNIPLNSIPCFTVVPSATEIANRVCLSGKA